MKAPPDEASAPSRWTVGELLRWTEGLFGRLGLPTPRLDAELLLAKALGITRVGLYVAYERPTDPEERACFRELVKRRSRREPVAYLIGQREFFSLSFEVTPDVLVPRPETEHLVEFAIDSLEERSADPTRILDLGTGSGNIAIAVAANAPQVRVDAVDTSAAALGVARRNALRHGVGERVAFHLGDLFRALPAGSGPYFAILSNPPYISKRDFGGLMDDVRLYEPREALCDLKTEEGDGSGFYRAMAAEGGSYLEDGGYLAVEVGAGQSSRVAEIFTAAGWEIRRRISDYSRIERVVVAGKSRQHP
jgi:release factor glutamine methyltransferase